MWPRISPTWSCAHLISLVDDSGIGEDVIRKLKNHKVNTDYIRRTPDGMGTWLAVFDNDGDVCASISKRPDLSQIAEILDEHGDAIFRGADSIILEFDMDKEIVKQVLRLAEKIRQGGLRRCLEHEHRGGAPQPAAIYRLLRVQPAGGRHPFSQKITKARRPRR